MAAIKGGSWVWSKDYECLVPKAQFAANQHNYFNELRSDLPCPNVIPGGMPEIRSMADGRYYSTKRNYEKSVHRHGCEIVGFDKRWQEHVKAPKAFGADRDHDADLVSDVKRAIQEVETKKPARARYRKAKRALS